MGGGNTCKACFTDCTATCKGCFKEADTNGNYLKKLFTDCCADPGLAFYSCLCPCLLQGQISQAQGRNCCSACLCTLGPALAGYVPCGIYLCYCSTCCYDIPDRMDFGKQNYVEACFSVGCCCNVPGRVQLRSSSASSPGTSRRSSGTRPRRPTTSRRTSCCATSRPLPLLTTTAAGG